MSAFSDPNRSIFGQILAISLVILALHVASTDSQSSPSQSICAGKLSCHDCIQASNCQWCSQPNFTQPRCHTADADGHQCPGSFTVDPRNELFKTEARELTKSSKVSGGSTERSSGSRTTNEIVQIYPQRVDLKLRNGKVYKLDVKYSQAEDYPVDLYYLMDLSQSMADDKEKLSLLGEKLSKEMQSITNNFRLGFGSFVDKVLMPFVSTAAGKVFEQCDDCEAPYGFKNQMPLSSDTKLFSDKVKNASVSGNLDAPEGGLDAVMQAVVCREQIGWRPNARRLLLFSTDAGFHYAGDGKLAGLIVPNDGQCHLDSSGLYTHSTVQDFPSISQINRKVKQNAINVIFAVTQSELSVYQGLSKLIEGSSAAMLSDDSSNIVSLVKDEYDKISSSVEMRDNHTESLLEVKYYSTCKDGVRSQRSKCEGLKVGDSVQFEVEITLLKCPADPTEWNHVLQIYPVGINESLTVDIEMLCGCPCETRGHDQYKEKADECSGVGTFNCGVCDCGDSFTGERCGCSAEDAVINFEDSGACRQSNTSSVCSARGNCVCGKCECDKREKPEEKISGKFCECDNFSCDRLNGMLCSGPKQGRCECGQCVCQEGWTGTACDCRTSEETCISPVNGKVCSGHGTCACGACSCDTTKDGRYSGPYCEKCITCPGRRCSEFEKCVQCMHYKNGPLSASECASNCTLFETIPVPKIVVDEENGYKKCTFSLNQCRYEFMYKDINGQIELKVLEHPDCPIEPFTLGIVLAVVGAVVLVGLAVLLLWKILTTIYDRREYARFEKEQAMAKWDEADNPIYKEPTTTFKNPTYADK